MPGDGPQPPRIGVFSSHFSSCLIYSLSQIICFFFSPPPPAPLPAPFLPLSFLPHPLPLPLLVAPSLPLLPCPLGGRQHLSSSQPQCPWAWSGLAHTHVDFTGVSLIPLGGSSRPAVDEKTVLLRLCRGWRQSALAAEGQGCCL